ncbi:MAG: cell division protein FtsB [Gammaproteobacteria bacterium]|nr:cell division protein FtsB [Gammaproteobacteria bacterium]MCP5201610.1 cell division protein FtsB [Gammaproteobacteria bacterium]
MRVFIALLVMVTLYLQYVLWFERGGVRDVTKLERAVAEQHAEIERLRERNQALAAEVVDLKQGLEAIEERARSDMGMIKQGEVFFRMTDPLPEGDPEGAGDGPAHTADGTP